MPELTDAAYRHAVSPQLLCGLTSFEIKPETYGCVQKAAATEAPTEAATEAARSRL